MQPTEGGTGVEGSGDATHRHYTHDIQPGVCEGFMGPFTARWPMDLTGRFTDQVLSFEVSPPSITVDAPVTGSCGTAIVPYEIAHFVGWADITFTDGKYEYFNETPHQAPDTGSTRVWVRLEQRD